MRRDDERSPATPSSMCEAALVPAPSMCEDALLPVAPAATRPRHTRAIAGALGANGTLCFLRFDGNQPGFAGQSALLCAVRDSQQPGRELRVSLSDCSAGDAQQDDELFDSSDPCDDYDLDLSLPYELWVAEQLLKVERCPPETRPHPSLLSSLVLSFSLCRLRR